MASMTRNLKRGAIKIVYEEVENGGVMRFVEPSIRTVKRSVGKARKRLTRANHRKAMAFAAAMPMDAYHTRLADARF